VGRLLLMSVHEGEGRQRRELLGAPDTCTRLRYEKQQLQNRLEATAACVIINVISCIRWQRVRMYVCFSSERVAGCTGHVPLPVCNPLLRSGKE
jgi:hypothetical protein